MVSLRTLYARVRVPPLLGVAVGALGMATMAAGCGTDAEGVDSCRSIEEARCRRAPACGIVLDPPQRTSGDAVSACIRFYDIACLHGLEVADPGPASVNACVDAIESDPTCAAVSAPQGNAACAWLAPPSTAPGDSGAAAPDAGGGLDADSEP